MANGIVEIHDVLSKENNRTDSTNCDPKSTSDMDNMADTMEFRILMAYAKRRRTTRDAESTKQDTPTEPNGSTPSSPQTPAGNEKDEEKPKEVKKKNKGKRLLRIFSCIKPRTKDEEPVQTPAREPDVDNRCGQLTDDEVETKDEVEHVASLLTEIADEIPFIPPEIEEDSAPDDVEKVIGLLLREAGDKLNEEELKKVNITAEIFSNYGFFKKLMEALLVKMGLISEPDRLGPTASPKTQIAVCCEVTSRLSAVDTLPMSRMLYHGARYLQDHYSSWAQQQGGYEEAFDCDDKDDDQ
uniref:apoptosis facilitator Bcl-2-like protein 14 n=1 Tax=Scatophagus argus TaxID=75038 RepID=UPI001ED7EF90|nr:apoptosis facilitator Bcl-2-like protein 14 [Scatophagus argus]